PSLLHMDTPPDEPYDLHLPAGAAAVFEDRVGSIPENKRSSWRYHLVTAGDTLASVAREYHLQPAALAEVNQLSEDSNLQGQTALVVPVAPEAAPSHRALYTTRRGDTLVTIADRFGVSLTELRSWNHLTGTRVEPGKRLHVAEPAPAEHASGSRHHSSSAGREQHSKTRARNVSETDSATSKKTHAGSAKTSARGKSRTSHKRSEMANAARQK
ncbi:MAG TPA: LysM peptidoglycan-binding domain-containing protein, partial [Acidobacteriaceae bacterium]